MAHFAEIDENNIVQRVIVVSNDCMNDMNGNEREHLGQNFLENLFGAGRYIQTSYSSSFRAKFATIGDEWRADLDAFVSPKPYPSWTLNTTTCRYEAPVAIPDDGRGYMWDEDNQTWSAFEGMS